MLAIPPHKDYAVPQEVQKMCESKGITDAMLEKAREDFVTRCENDYYLEWFWFPYQEDCWINTWSRKLDDREQGFFSIDTAFPISL